MAKRIKYTEPGSYFPKEVREQIFGTPADTAQTKRQPKSKKPTIDDYADRMSSPVGITLTDPVTRQPIKNNSEDGD